MSHYNWTCLKCGATGSFSACRHSSPSSDPTKHNSRIYNYSAYGYSGTEQQFTVYSVRIINQTGCTAKLTGKLVNYTAMAGTWLTISISGYTGNYPQLTFRNDDNGSVIDTSIYLKKNGTYYFQMPANPVVITVSDTTYAPNTLALGSAYAGPYSVFQDWYKGSLRVRPGQSSYYWYDTDKNKMVTVIHHCIIVSKGVKGTIKYSCNGESGSYGPFTPINYTPPYQYKYSDFSDVEHTICDQSIIPRGSSYADVSQVQFTYTPSQEDVNNKVKYGSVGSASGGTVTNWKTVTSTSPITVTCAYFAVVAPDFPGNCLDTTAVAQTITAKLSSTSVGYGAVAPTLTVSGAKTSLSYSSSNEAVATISSTGAITIAGLGDTIITIDAAQTSAYLKVQTTVSLKVVKGSLKVTTSPTGSQIIYGQPLSSSILTGGSIVNGSNKQIAGSWAWKEPSTVPTGGTASYVARYTPDDKAHYDY